jgi:tRNA1(Val) A37 N6-methylase TrmN6
MAIHDKPGPTAGEDLTDDSFLGGAVRLLQPKAGYRAGLDAVLLAAAAPVAAGARARVLDAGAGVGTVGLCLAHRIGDAEVTLVEREEELAALARRNATRNGLARRVRVVIADIARGGALAHGRAAHTELPPSAFDHVLANPPYRTEGTGTAAAGRKAAAYQFASGDLERWVAFLATVARHDASLTMIHEAAALGGLLAALDSRFGAIRVYPLFPRTGAAAIRVIVQGRRSSRAPLVLLPGLVLHAEGPGFTPAAEAILWHGAPLTLAP